MTKKEFGRCIAFLLVVCVTLYLLCDLFELKNTYNYDKRFATYRKLNENTVDAVWVGTSGVDRYWIAPKAYEEYGITLFPLSYDSMPMWLYESMIEEAYTYQTPQLIIADMRAFGQYNIDARTLDVRGRRALDMMDFFSVNRIKTAFTVMQIMHETFDEPRFNLSYLLSFIKYHTMWKDDDYLISRHLGSKAHAYMGFHMSTNVSTLQTPLEINPFDYECYEALDPLAEDTLYALLEYASVNNIELLFVDTPQCKNEIEMGRSNALMQILEEEGVNYINFCETDEHGNFIYNMNLDLETDFYDESHVNYYGAEKFTEIFSAYLEEHYDLPDRRGDNAVQEQWDGIYDKIKNRIAKLEKETILESEELTALESEELTAE